MPGRATYSTSNAGRQLPTRRTARWPNPLTLPPCLARSLQGLKVQEAADRQGRTPLELSDDVSRQFRKLFELADVGFTDYVRTTEPRHARAATALWERLEAAGTIYKGSYEGWYSVSDETFLADSQVIRHNHPNGGVDVAVCGETGNPVVRMREENYMFRLSDFGAALTAWLDTNPGAIVPRAREGEVRSFIADGLPDLSVSRSAAKLTWGIPVPGDRSHTMYVWLDALANYLTVAGYPDRAAAPADVHVVGKDILKFHAIYWPAFLLAAGLPLPRTIVAHSHWTLDGKKMSKSLGNVVDPKAKLAEYGVDQLRFFLLRDGRLKDDADFTDARVMAAVDELANKLGNLYARSTGKKVNPSGTVPDRDAVKFGPAETELLNELNRVPSRVAEYYDTHRFSDGIDAVMAVLRATNVYFDGAKPWVLAKRAGEDPVAAAKLRTVLYTSFEALRLSGIMLQPVVPRVAAELLDRLGVELGEPRSTAALEFGRLDGETLGHGPPLVRKPGS